MTKRCPQCGGLIKTQAETFIHQQVHSELFGTVGGLNQLPFRFWPRVVRLMEDYALAAMSGTLPQVAAPDDEE